MGEIADLISDGAICQVCHQPMNDAGGYPRACRRCKAIRGEIVIPLKRGRLKPVKNHECTICHKRFKKLIGLNAHHRDVHEPNRKEANE